MRVARFAGLLLAAVLLSGCGGEDDAAVRTTLPEGIEVEGDTVRLEGFATVTANANGHTRVIVRQPDPAHTTWLRGHGYRFVTFRVDTGAAQPDASELLPDSLRFERDLAPGTLLYARPPSSMQPAQTGADS